MTSLFLPEGRKLHSPENNYHCGSCAGLYQAMNQNLVLEGHVLQCTVAHDLVVQFGSFTSTMPREEVAIGVEEGTTRDIAILSRVGKPISFLVTHIDDQNGELVIGISRRKAQEMAQKMLMSHVQAGMVLPATVTHLEPFGAFVDIGCGLVSMIGIEHISISRIAHPNLRFTTGQEIFVLVSNVDTFHSRIYLTHKELLGTWEENASLFAHGMTVQGIVRGVKNYGVFIELTPNLSGLAENQFDLLEGDRVSVFIKSLNPDSMKIKLLVIDRLNADLPPFPLHYFTTSGSVSHWQYAPENCLKSGAESYFN